MLENDNNNIGSWPGKYNDFFVEWMMSVGFTENKELWDVIT